MEIQAQSKESIDAESHFAFDWNGWGIGVENETDPAVPPSLKVGAWQSQVLAIVSSASLNKV